MMNNEWKSTLYDVLSNHFDMEMRAALVDKVTESLGEHTSFTPKRHILLPTYISAYVIGFIGIDLEKQKLYYCVDDQKTGAADVFEEFDLSDDDTARLKQEKWPYDAHHIAHYIRTTRAYHYLFKENE